jgi:hypothetical protein
MQLMPVGRRLTDGNGFIFSPVCDSNEILMWLKNAMLWFTNNYAKMQLSEKT